MTQVRGNQLKNQSVTKTQIGNKEITSQQVADGAITNQQVSPSAAIDQDKIDGLVAALASKLDRDGSSVATGPIILAGDPTNPLEATPKQYVDRVAAGSKALLAKNFNLLDDNIDPLHAPFSTTNMGTQSVSVFDNSQNFITIGHSNYSVMTTTVAVDLGTNKFLYQLGGSQGTQVTEIRNVSKTTLSPTGSQGTWTSVGTPDLPENATSTGKADILTSSLGKHIIFAKGKGDNLLWRSKVLNTTDGSYAGWDLLSPLPINTGDPDTVILNISGDETGYILANNAGGSSELIITNFDTNGDVLNYTVNTIPQTLVGKLVALNSNYIYIFGTGTFSDKCFIGTINQITKNISWATVTTALPTGLTKFGVSINSTTEGNDQVYIYGGLLNGVLQDTIYYATVDEETGSLGTFSTISAKLETATAGMGISSIEINNKTHIYATGGQVSSGFIDNSTSKELVAVRTFNIIKRTIGSGLFYHVNKTSESRPQQDFLFQPDLMSDSTLSKPINVFYFARKDSTHLDYVTTISVDPTLPEDISNSENLLIRMDQIDPSTGSIISIPVVTSPVQTNDYLAQQKPINQVFAVDMSLITTSLTEMTFADGTFTIGNIDKIFKTTLKTITLPINGSLWVYWSDYDIITSDEILPNKILLGQVSFFTEIIFTPATTGVLFERSNLTELVTGSSLELIHGFNTDFISVTLWSLDGSDVVLNGNVKIIKKDLNTIRIVKNNLTEQITIQHLLVKKEK